MASICSVTIMEPSSLAMPEALRPETMSAVTTGPISLIMEKLTSWPVKAAAPNWVSVAADCSASTPPRKKPVRMTMGREPTPMMSACMKMSAAVERLAEDVAEGAAGEDGVLLDGEDASFGGSIDGVEGHGSLQVTGYRVQGTGSRAPKFAA